MKKYENLSDESAGTSLIPISRSGFFKALSDEERAVIKRKGAISIVSTALAVFFSSILLYQGGRPPEWGKYSYHLFLYLGVAGIYWLLVLMYYFHLKKQKGSEAVESLSDLIYPMTALVVLSVLFLGFFAYNDDQYRAASGSASAIGWSRFGISFIEVFPGIRFPLGVIMYAFWGAFIYNTSHFIRRIIDDDFVPRVVVLATLRITLAIFAAILIYFAFFSDVFKFKEVDGNLIAETQGETQAVGLLIVASFLTGLYPRRSMKMVSHWSAGRLSQMFPKMGKYTYTPLTIIQGITLEIEDRLNEEGIDSIQALATCDLRELKKKRSFPYPDGTLADWMDQAKLALYFSDEAEFTAIQGLGIRTYSAVLEFQKTASKDPSILDALDPAPIPKERFRHFILHGIFPSK